MWPFLVIGLGIALGAVFGNIAIGAAVGIVAVFGLVLWLHWND